MASTTDKHGMPDIKQPASFLGASFDCACGRRHEVPTRHVIYSPDAIDRIPSVLAPEITGRACVVIADQRTRDVAGARVLRALVDNGWTCREIILPDPPGAHPVCNDHTHDWLARESGTADVFIAVGSGVVNDLTKWVAHDRATPYAVVATAASMNGYTAANVAPTIRGVKCLIRAQAPVAVLAVPSIIEHAPLEMTLSGFGDVIAKPMSTADWMMNHALFAEHYCPLCAGMITRIEPLYLDRPRLVRDRDPKAIKGLFDALVYSGVAMTMMGTSAPASGGEHLFSHTLDMMSSVDGVPHDLHGRQVGLGTIFAAALYERILDALSRGTAVPTAMPASIDAGFWKGLAPAVQDEYTDKIPRLTALRNLVDAGELGTRLDKAVRTRLKTPREIASALEQAGAARRLPDVNCSRDRARAAILHMHEIRKRPSVVDLAWTTGILAREADALIDEWLV
ncbi:sn-glycerol-1-phosphate dehydrogenase [bacterium]|nr:sn-glycerol-1-phosphate dehydrogenase [bacterium]